MITSKFIWESIEKHNDKTFYVNNTTAVSYEQFYKKVKQLASQKELLYIKKVKVALIIDSSLESLITYFALICNGAIPVLLSEQRPKVQISDLLKSIKCEHAVDVENVIKELSENSKVNLHPIETEDATIIFTSGTTSIPKAILHTFSNHYYSALGSKENIALQKNDRWLLSLPLHHIGGLSIVFRTLLAGGTLVGYDKTVPIEDTIADHKVTHVSVVATQLKRILHYPEKLKSLKAILVGGGFVPDDLITKAVELNLPIYKTYGMSEMSSQVTTTSQNASSEELQTSGKVLKYIEIKIADDNEILVRGEVLSESYLNADMNIDADGWFHSGDIGSLDSNNNLTVLGRKDRMFISGGENIYPEPIEKILMQMDNISEVCIVPKDDAKFGHLPVLFYQTTKGQDISIISVKEFLQNKVLPFEIPKELYNFPKEYKPLGIKPNYAFLKTWLHKQ